MPTKDTPSKQPSPSAGEEAKAKLEGVAIGRIVHYVLSRGHHVGHHRPALIVALGDNETVNLQVLTDGTNDFDFGYPGSGGLLWATSVPYDASGAQLGSWHWPERV